MKAKMHSGKRSYDQWCAVARSLDIVGERWTMLIVRDLLIGPKRYTDILGGLPGIGTNLLAQRLRELEAHGLVERSLLPAPARPTDAMLPAPFFVSLHASFNPTARPGLKERYAFRIDDRIFEVEVAGGR